MDTKACGEQDCLTFLSLGRGPKLRSGPRWVSAKFKGLSWPQAWPALAWLELEGKEWAEGVTGSSSPGLQSRSRKHIPPDTPATHSTSTHTCYSQSQTHHPFGSQITPLSALKRWGTPEHTPQPQPYSGIGPSGARGAARCGQEGGAMATGSTLGISAENSKDTPAPPGQH